MAEGQELAVVRLLVQSIIDRVVANECADTLLQSSPVSVAQNGHTDIIPEQHGLAPSPASALANALSELTLQTPLRQRPSPEVPNGMPAASSAVASTPQSAEVVANVPSKGMLIVAPPAKARGADRSIGLCYDRIMEAHVGPADHVERPMRTALIMKVLNATGLAARCSTICPRQATDSELRLAHSEEHIAYIDTSGPEDWACGDNFFSEATPVAARTATGCTVQGALQQVQAAGAGGGGRIVRRGFCFYNNVAVAALAARLAGARPLVLDWDVHHGNGVQDILWEEDIPYISLHRGAGFYPGTGQAEEVGAGAGRGRTLNLPWPRGNLGDADYIAAFELARHAPVIEPYIRELAPDLIIVSAGFDAAEGDLLGGMRLSPACYGYMTAALARLCPQVVLALEGGYNVSISAECAAECVAVLLGGKPRALAGRGAARPAKETGAVLAAAAAAHAATCRALAPMAEPGAWDAYCLALQAKRALCVRGSSRARAES